MFLAKSCWTARAASTCAAVFFVWAGAALAAGTERFQQFAGNNDALKTFTIKDEGQKDGLEWMEAVPKEREGGFERIRMAFGQNGPAVMELSDAFGQRTVLRFTGFERNARIDPAMFRFTPP